MAKTSWQVGGSDTLRFRLLMGSSFGLMWLLSKLGLTRQVVGLVGRQMQSPRIKARAFEGYEPTEHDVIVCTYAKSGTNWALQIAYQIAHLSQGEYEHIHAVVAWPEAPFPGIVPLSDPAPQASAPTGLRVIKTHLESPYVPYRPAAKYLVVVRDPKDVFVSSYHFAHQTFAQSITIPVADWFYLTLTSRQPFGSWAEHLASYWAWRERPNVLFLTFDELKADLPAAVRRIAALMGVALSEAQLARVVEQSTFAHMRGIDHKFAPPLPALKARTGPVMIRQGQSGVASSLLTPEQQAALDAFSQAKLRRLHCDFPYRDYFRSQPPPP